MTGIVFQIQRYCIHDGDGIRTCVFLKGCPLHCPWCHNPEGISPKPQTDKFGSVYGTEMTAEEVFAAASRDKSYYALSGGGVTFTGGEPLAQADFLAETAELLKKAGISVAVETSGFAPSAAVEKIVPFTDRVLFDIKSFDGGKLKDIVGAEINSIMRNLAEFSAAGIPMTLRCPVIAGFNDYDAHFENIGKLAGGTENVTAVELLPYHRLGADKCKRLGIEPHEFNELSRDYLIRAEDTVRAYFDNVKVM